MNALPSPHRVLLRLMTAVTLTIILSAPLKAEQLVPGKGMQVKQVGDDFEDPNWKYSFNSPKSTHDIDHSQRLPGGQSMNSRWYEGIKRGHPDIIRRVETPHGGLLGSRGSLQLRSLHSGIPGYPSYRMRQDDLVCDVNYRLRGTIPVKQSPSCVVRVFLPPVAKWEERSGVHFGFRAAVDTTLVKQSANQPEMERKVYWPGMFIEFHSKSDGYDNDYAYIRIRSDRMGHDTKLKPIETTGWWTLGMSFTPNGQVHFYARPGVGDLKEENHITSAFPYGYRCEHFRTFFFNVCSGDDGLTWSTPWVIDDPALHVLPGSSRHAELKPYDEPTIGR